MNNFRFKLSLYFHQYKYYSLFLCLFLLYLLYFSKQVSITSRNTQLKEFMKENSNQILIMTTDYTEYYVFKRKRHKTFCYDF